MNLTLRPLQRLAWLNVPAGCLIALLQRTPVLRVAAVVEGRGSAPGIVQVLRSAISAVASIGAVQALVGATQFVMSRPSPISGTVGQPIQPVSFTYIGTPAPPASFRITGTLAPGLAFTPAPTSAGVVNASTPSIGGTPAQAGTFTIYVQGYNKPNATGDTNKVQVPIVFNIAAGTGGGGGSGVLPSFTLQPQTQTITSGSTVVFAAAAGGSPTPALQWQRDGVNLPGSTQSMLVLSGGAAVAGSYSVLATNSAGSTASSPATLTLAPATDVSRLVNLAIRTNAGTGAQTLIVGFAIGGVASADAKPLLLRGVGPSLGQFGLSNVLPDPQATVYQSSTVVAANDNWDNNTLVSDRAAAVGAFPLVAASLDAALAMSPTPSAYTVQILGKNDATGVALAEIYDATAPDAFGVGTARLINVSARTQVGTGADILIAGFVIGGSSAKTVLIRAIGPALSDFGVPGVLVDPKLQLFSGSTMLRENDDWGGDAQLTSVGNSVGAFRLADPAGKDAVLLVTLPPGSYTAQISGKNDGTGVALVEVYEVP